MIWIIAEALSWAVTALLIAYYAYIYGMMGVAYGVLAAAVGYMCILWFGDMMPIIGPLMRRWHRNRSDQ